MALTDNILNYWKLDESSGNAVDAVGGATLTNTSTTYGTGKINNGAISNGSSSKLVGTIADPDSYSSGYSWGGWLYWGGGTGQMWAVYIAESASWGTCYIGNKDSANGSGSTIVYKFGTGETNFFGTDSGYSMPTNTWFHVVATVNGTSQKLYVNGNLVSTATRGASLTNNGTTFAICSANGAYYWDGRIDEFAIWGRELSAADVNALYRNGAGRAYPLLPVGSGASKLRPAPFKPGFAR